MSLTPQQIQYLFSMCAGDSALLVELKNRFGYEMSSILKKELQNIARSYVNLDEEVTLLGWQFNI